MICDRRTGRAVDEVPAKALFPPGVYESADPPGEPQIQFEFAPGGALILTSYANPRLFRRKGPQAGASGRSASRRTLRRSAPDRGQRLASAIWRVGRRDWYAHRALVARKDARLRSYQPASARTRNALWLRTRTSASSFSSRFNGNVSQRCVIWRRARCWKRSPGPLRGRIHPVAPGVLSVSGACARLVLARTYAKRLGLWLSHPRSGEAAFVTESGQFEISGDQHLARRAALRTGPVELLLETCAKALLKPGIAARTLGFTAKAPK